MAGNAAVNAAVHGCFGDMLKHSCVVGNSHWEVRRVAKNYNSQKPPPKTNM